MEELLNVQDFEKTHVFKVKPYYFMFLILVFFFVSAVHGLSLWPSGL